MIINTTRRRLLKGIAGTSLVAASGLAAPALAQGRPIRIGYVNPQSGPLAAFSEADQFIISGVQRAMQARGQSVEIILKDSQSNPNRAADVAQELILDDEVDLILVASAPETTIPVTNVAEAEGVPCISTLCPWQPWFFGQQGGSTDPSTFLDLEYGFHFFWGLEDVVGVFTNLWNSLDTNRSIGALFPNDGDGNAWGDPVVGFPPVLEAQGFQLTDPGRYQNLTDDFSAQISAFEAANAEIVTGVVIPPDFTTFWTQARQRGFVPKAATIGKAILFPTSVAALGEIGHNLSSEIWWSPNHPHASSLSGTSAADLAAGFTAETGRPWTQPIGFIEALFEVAADCIGRATDPTDPDALRDAIAATNLDTVVGNVAWNGAGLPPFAQTNVAKTKLVGGQWRMDAAGQFDLVVVNNDSDPSVPVASTFEPITA